MFNNKRLTGIGDIEFLGANQMILTDEYAGICLMYRAVHGGEDQKNALNPKVEQELDKNFNMIFNN